MNPATRRTEGNATAPVLYIGLELSHKTWRLALSDGATRRQVRVPAADLLKRAEAVVKAKERFGMPKSARVPYNSGDAERDQGISKAGGAQGAGRGGMRLRVSWCLPVVVLPGG